MTNNPQSKSRKGEVMSGDNNFRTIKGDGYYIEDYYQEGYVNDIFISRGISIKLYGSPNLTKAIIKRIKPIIEDELAKAKS